MHQRLDFVREAMSNRFTMVELCERYGVSRRIGYGMSEHIASNVKKRRIQTRWIQTMVPIA